MILAIDCGSTNHKVAIFDGNLRRLSSCSWPVAYTKRDNEVVEFDPEQLWRNTVSLIRRACAEAQVEPRHIRTISLASQAQTFTLASRAGAPVIPFLSWADKRAHEEAFELEKTLREFHRHCSFAAPVPQLQISKLLWLARRMPPAKRVGIRIMTLPSFLAFRLAGLHGEDANLAAMSGLYSLVRGDWWDEAIRASGWPREGFGQVVQPGSVLQAQRPCAELSLAPELTVVFAGNDQTAGAYANGARTKGLVLTLGTALVAYRFAGESPGPFQAGGCWGPFGGGGFYELLTRDEGCAALDWAVSELCPGDEAGFLELASAGLGGGAYFYPQRMRSPDAWQGSSDTPARARAVLEGIAFSMRQLVEPMTQPENGRAVTVIGGGSASDAWLRLLANILNRPASRGTGDILLGAAMLACPTVEPLPCPGGVWFDPEIKQVEEYERRYQQWLGHAPPRAENMNSPESRQAATPPGSEPQSPPSGGGQRSKPVPSPLPYTDIKTIGAADFYFAINATFRFILRRFGSEALRRYWQELGGNYYAPVSAAWKAGGLPAVAAYWRAFFAAEPDAQVEVTCAGEKVVLEVRICPAIKHLRAGSREIIPCYCQHCYFVSESMAAPAAFTVRVQGGAGSCRQTFLHRGEDLPEQKLEEIREVA